VCDRPYPIYMQSNTEISVLDERDTFLNIYQKWAAFILNTKSLAGNTRVWSKKYMYVFGLHPCSLCEYSLVYNILIFREINDNSSTFKEFLPIRSRDKSPGHRCNQPNPHGHADSGWKRGNVNTVHAFQMP
jgi:hypothetical protein